MTAAEVMGSLRDYQTVMDKQLTPYQHTLRTLQSCSRFKSQSVQMCGYVFHDTNGRNHGPAMKIPVVPERNLYGHPLAGLLWERQFEEVLLGLGWEKVPNWECLFVH